VVALEAMLDVAREVMPHFNELYADRLTLFASFLGHVDASGGSAGNDESGAPSISAVAFSLFNRVFLSFLSEV
jgi:hypothetical protein